MKTLSEKLDVFFSTCSTEAYQRCFLRFVSSLEHEPIQATPGCSVMRGEESGPIISCALKRPSDVVTQTTLSDILLLSSCRQRSQTSFQCCHAVYALRRPSAVVTQKMLGTPVGSWSPVSEIQCADTAHKTAALLQWQASERGHISPFYREVSYLRSHWRLQTIRIRSRPLYD